MRGFGGRLSRGIGPDVDRSAQRHGRRFGSIFGKAAAGPLRFIGRGFLLTGAIAGIVSLTGAFKSGITQAEQYQRLQQQTAGVIKSTGNAANISVKGVQRFAANLEHLSGIDETQVIQGENVLATFTGIHNQLGRGNAIFNRATRASLNLSAALGQDVQSSAIQVGKALNDPIRGVTALRRVGVSFTKQQTDQIKALVASGHTLKAQKLILAELNKEFGNAGKAAGQGFPGALARAKDAVGDTVRSIGLRALPTLTRLANGFSRDLPKAVGFLSRTFAAAKAFTAPFFASLGAAVKSALPGLRVLAVQVGGQLFTALRNLAVVALPIVAQGWQAFRLVAGVVGQLLTGVVIPAIVAVTGFLAHHRTVVAALVVGIGVYIGVMRVWTAVTKTVILVTKAWAVAQRLLNLALAANPIVLVIAAVAALAVGLIYAYKHSETFRNIVQGVFKAVAHAAGNVAHAAMNVAHFFVVAFESTERAAGAFVSIIVTGFRHIADIWLAVVGGIIHGAAAMFGWVPKIGPKLKRARDAFDQFHGQVDRTLSGIAASAERWGADIARGLAHGIEANGQLAVSAAQALANRVHISVAAALRVRSPSKVMQRIGEMVTAGLVKGILEHPETVAATMRKLVGLVTRGFGPTDPLTLLITRQAARLTALTTGREHLAARMAAANQRLTDLRQARADTRSNVTGGAREFASLSTAAPLADDGTINPGRILASLRGALRTIRARGTALRRLARLGLNRSLLTQLWGMDPASGLAYARAILSDRSFLAPLGRVQRAIDATSGRQGRQAGNVLYGQGIAMARGLVQGLRSHLKPLRAAMRDLADAMVDELRKRLKMHSPSQVFADLGRDIGAGLASGIDSSDAAAAIVRLADVRLRRPSLDDVRLPELAATGTDGGVHVHLDKWADRNVRREVIRAADYADRQRRVRRRTGRRA